LAGALLLAGFSLLGALTVLLARERASPVRSLTRQVLKGSRACGGAPRGSESIS
jgi:hypothetical protein